MPVNKRHAGVTRWWYLSRCLRRVCRCSGGATCTILSRGPPAIRIYLCYFFHVVLPLEVVYEVLVLTKKKNRKYICSQSAPYCCGIRSCRLPAAGFHACVQRSECSSTGSICEHLAVVALTSLSRGLLARVTSVLLRPVLPSFFFFFFAVYFVYCSTDEAPFTRGIEIQIP